MDAWQVGAVLAIIGPGVGVVIGRLTSGAAGYRRDLAALQSKYDDCVEDATLLGLRCKSLDTSLAELEATRAADEATIRNQGRRIAEYVMADQKRHEQRKAAAIKAGERSHRDRLAREAEANAKQSALHETMSHNMGDTLRARAATPEGAEPVKPSPASLASLSQGATL